MCAIVVSIEIRPRRVVVLSASVIITITLAIAATRAHVWVEPVHAKAVHNITLAWIAQLDRIIRAADLFISMVAQRRNELAA